MDLITIKTYDNSIDPYILKARLESENILCFLIDEHIITVNPMYNIPIGGIKLKVHKENAERAFAIVKEIENTPIVLDDNTVLTCPKCKKSEFYDRYHSTRNFKELFTAIVGFLIGVFPIFSKPVYKCKHRGSEIDMNKKKKNLSDF